MKKINFTKSFIIVVLTALTVASLSYTAYAKFGGVSREPTFEYSKDWNKVGSTLQTLYLEAKKDGTLAQKVECFVVVRSPGEPGDEDLLFGVGYSTQVFSGPVARGHMKLQDLPRVANLYFVKQINLAN